MPGDADAPPGSDLHTTVGSQHFVVRKLQRTTVTGVLLLVIGWERDFAAGR